MDELKELVKVYDEYYKCSNPNCHSVYHVSNFNKKDFECRDCKTFSRLPEELQKKRKK